MTVQLDVARGRLRAWQSAAEPNRSLKHNTPGEDSEYDLERNFDEELETFQSSCLLHISTPLPRSPINLSVEFTKLETEMPARETRESEIRQWKQGFRARPDQQHSIADREPLFLKERGDIFFRAGNYQSAINVYTLAITAEKQQVKRFNEGSFYRRLLLPCGDRLLSVSLIQSWRFPVGWD